MKPDFIFNMIPGDIVYDIEVYPNIFCIGLHHVIGKQWYFEISHRRNDLWIFSLFLEKCQQYGCRLVGYNNVGYDYPVLHFIYMNRNCVLTAPDIYNKSMSIINAQGPNRFKNVIWEDQRLVNQVDLFKIHHFDNKAKSTSLKVLEFNMRMNNIEDLPFPVGTVLDDGQCDMLAEYMWHDIKATTRFYDESTDRIRFREELSEKYDRNFINHNDTKIGKDFFIMKLEESNPGCCYRYVDGKRKMVQSIRESINLNDIILPYISFDHPEFNRILQWFRSQVITETKGVFKDISCTVSGFQFDFGTGGIHGSVESQMVYSDEYWIVEDWDVASYYPNLAIKNKLYPQHLGEVFCTLYEEMYHERKQHKKGTAENAMLKLALNGTYGDSNNKYSPFYDPKFTMSITINGQLSLCMLAEQLMKLESLQMIQANTDGITVRYPRQHMDWVHSVCAWWETVTGLELEDAEYSRMFIRDVNNYLAEGKKIKRKGAYEYELAWHQNHSNLVVPKAAEAALLHGTDIRQFIQAHRDPFDFCLRAKVPRSSELHWGENQVSNIVRYFIALDGEILKKVMPPKGTAGEYKRANGLTDVFYNTVMGEIGPGIWDERIHTKNRSVYEERHIEINTGWMVQLCNDMKYFDWSNLNYEWYIKEAEKLVKPIIE